MSDEAKALADFGSVTGQHNEFERGAEMADLMKCVSCGKPVPDDAENCRYYEESGDILGPCCPMTDEEWAR